MLTEAWHYVAALLAPAAASAFVGLAVGVVSRYVRPTCQLSYGPIRMLDTADAAQTTRRAVVYLVCSGRRDIPSSAYDQGKPVEIDLGVRIQELTRTSSSVPTTRLVGAHAEGTALVIGPGLISRRQVLGFILQIDGEPSGLRCRTSLIDVKIRRQRHRPGAVRTVVTIVAFILINVFLLTFSFAEAPLRISLALTVGLAGFVVSVIAHR
jgi:hypothetical protein